MSSKLYHDDLGSGSTVVGMIASAYPSFNVPSSSRTGRAPVRTPERSGQVTYTLCTVQYLVGAVDLAWEGGGAGLIRGVHSLSS